MSNWGGVCATRNLAMRSSIWHWFFYNPPTFIFYPFLRPIWFLTLSKAPLHHCSPRRRFWSSKRMNTVYNWLYSFIFITSALTGHTSFSFTFVLPIHMWWTETCTLCNPIVHICKIHVQLHNQPWPKQPHTYQELITKFLAKFTSISLQKPIPQLSTKNQKNHHVSFISDGKHIITFTVISQHVI